MSLFYSGVGTAIAKARLAVDTVIGVTAVFKHRGATLGSTLIVKVVSDGNKYVRDGNGIVTEVRVIVFRVAVQTGFLASANDVEPVTPGDVMTYQGRDYQVLDNVEKDRWGTTYHLSCEEDKRLGSGIG